MARRSLIDLFVSHKVASNVVILLFLILGCTALFLLNTQFLPKFGQHTVVVSVVWPGASPADVEQAITVPIEKELDSLDNVLRMNSVSSQGLSLILIDFKQAVNIEWATQDVRDKVSRVPYLPEDAKPPKTVLADIYHPIARVILSTSDHPRALRYWTREAQQQLLDLGIDKVTINGMPDEDIHIGVSPEQLLHLRSSLTQIAEQIASQSQDIAAGDFATTEGARQLRSESLARTPTQVGDMPIISGDVNQLLGMFDIATITQRPKKSAAQIFYKGQPAVELSLFRMQKSDALGMARTLYKWQSKAKETFPSGVHIHVYYELWKLIKERIQVLLHNGLWGMLLIIGLLFLFLSSRVGLWVAAAVPLSLLGALFLLWVLGGSINMISLFALIMTLGIIVDDTIVVAEEGLRLFQSGDDALTAATQGAKRMAIPILASSLTTMAAFSPLLFLGGLMGNLMMTIPLVVICVIFCSLVECFFVLPFHLKQSFIAMEHETPKPYRQRLDQAFSRFRDHYYKRFLLYCIEHRPILFSAVGVSILLVIGLLASGRVPFTFFPSPDGTLINADITFAAGTSADNMTQYIFDVEQAAWKASEGMEQGGLIKHVVQYLYKGADPSETRSSDRLASVVVELVTPEKRDITNQQFINSWRKYLPKKPWVEDVRVMAPRSGLPGSDINFGLYGASVPVLKKAAGELSVQLAKYRGVYNVTDNMPFAQNDYLFTLKPEAHALGLTTEAIGSQLRASFAGQLVQTHYYQNDKVDVIIQLDDQHRSYLSALQRFPIVTQSGKVVPLASLVTVTEERSFGELRHLDKRLTVNVQAEVDASQGNINQILAAVLKTDMPTLSTKYGLRYTMKGRIMEESSIIKEMKVAVLAMLIMIYLILVWVSSSYAWPLFVMVAVPLGLEGAVLGHWWLGRDLTMLSLFGFFALTGIVINDSIILLFRYKELLKEGVTHVTAITQASCQRLRPVILTSLTTIAGLSPLLFEKSMQAQFLIPMAISICFGLLFSTVLILVVIPALIVGLYRAD